MGGSGTTSSDGPGRPARRASVRNVFASMRSQNAFMSGPGCLGQRYCSQLNGVVVLRIELCAGARTLGVGFGFGPVAVCICAAAGAIASSTTSSHLFRISMSTPLVPGS